MDKREAILNAAAALFTTRGFQETTTAEISRHAEVATGTLFNYFPSKMELINQLFLHCKESMAAALRVEEAEQADYRTAFSTLWERGIRWGTEHPQMFWFFRQYQSSPYVTNLRHREASLRFEFIHSFLARGVENDILRDGPLELLYTFVISSTSGVVEELLLSGADTELYITASFELMWSGISR
ncbi:MAG: TetR family transcriptional regulator [Spirochaetes bacterium]|jgi:AcrR family transcriptional regulator|nr:TetR family transcriptional regulator [Spirochaetota bacterium]